MHLVSSVSTGKQTKAHPCRLVSAHEYCTSFKHHANIQRCFGSVDQRVLFCFLMPGNKTIVSEVHNIL